jgi:hypothetical protein
MPRTPRFESHQIPQADNLDDVRRVIAGVADGATPPQISERTEISARHVSYALQAARTLGWLAPADKLEVTDLGRELLATAPGGLEERDCFRRSITESDVLKGLAPELLAPATPSRDDLTARIRRPARCPRPLRGDGEAPRPDAALVAEPGERRAGVALRGRTG